MWRIIFTLMSSSDQFSGPSPNPHKKSKWNESKSGKNVGPDAKDLPKLKTHVVNLNSFGAGQNGNDQKLHGHSTHHAKKWNIKNMCPSQEIPLNHQAYWQSLVNWNGRMFWACFKKFWISSKNLFQFGTFMVTTQENRKCAPEWAMDRRGEWHLKLHAHDRHNKELNALFAQSHPSFFHFWVCEKRTFQFEVAASVKPNLETLALILNPQSAVFLRALRPVNYV